MESLLRDSGSDEPGSSVYKSEKDIATLVDSRHAVSHPPPLLSAVTSSPRAELGHVASPVATAAAIWAVLPSKRGGEFATSSDVGRYPCTTEHRRAAGGNYVDGEDLPEHLLPYRDLVYPASYPDTADSPAWSTAAAYYPRVPLTADLPPAVHHQSLIMSSCDPAAYPAGEEWYASYNYQLPAAGAVAAAGPYQRLHHQTRRLFQRIGQPAAAAGSTSGGGGGNGTTKRKRRRIITTDQRRAANVRERRRMSHLNDAFDRLRKRVPTFAYEKKLSRIETLRLAVTYISFMADLLETMDGDGVRYDLLAAAAAAAGDGAGYGADGSGAAQCGLAGSDEFRHGRSSTAYELSDVDGEFDDDDDDEDDTATGSCSPGLSCPEDMQEPLELTNYRDGVVDSTTVCATTVSNHQPVV